MNAGSSYRKAAAAGASPVQLVILLYEQAIADLRCALAAHGASDVEGRTRQINHAILVIGHLEATLDKEQGGAPAANLERFYQHVRQGLVEAQIQQSAALLERWIAQLMQLHGAWCDVEKSRLAASSPSQQPGGTQSRSEWNA